MKKDWFDREDFWSGTSTVLFHQERMEKTKEQVDCVLGLAGIKKGGAVLDLCCGIGRHSLEFARRGYAVTGVDRTKAYLKKAAASAEKEKLDVKFVQSDMRRFVKPDSFDLAVNLFTSFGYFDDPEDDRTVVENVFRSLRKGGRFVIDMMGKEVMARNFRERDWSEGKGFVIMEKRRLYDDWSKMETTWTILEGNKKHVHTFNLRLYSASELKSLLVSCGFSVAIAYGDLAGAGYDHTARRLVVAGIK